VIIPTSEKKWRPEKGARDLREKKSNGELAEYGSGIRPVLPP
jgi:hypothetical protein